MGLPAREEIVNARNKETLYPAEKYSSTETRAHARRRDLARPGRPYPTRQGEPARSVRLDEHHPGDPGRRAGTPARGRVRTVEARGRPQGASRLSGSRHRAGGGIRIVRARPRQVRHVAVPASQERRHRGPLGQYPARDAPRPFRRSGFQRDVGPRVRGRTERQQDVRGPWRQLPGLSDQSPDARRGPDRRRDDDHAIDALGGLAQRVYQLVAPAIAAARRTRRTSRSTRA